MISGFDGVFLSIKEVDALCDLLFPVILPAKFDELRLAGKEDQIEACLALQRASRDHRSLMNHIDNIEDD
jgi:hypothetical protein